MNPGVFDRIISIYQLEEYIQSGSVNREYALYKEHVRAKLVTKNGAKNQIADQVQGTTSVEFIYNTKDAPLTKSRDIVIYNESTYKIDAVFEMPEYGRDRYSKIVAQLVINNA